MAIDRAWVDFDSRAHLRTWLTDNHADSPGVWAVYPKASTGASDLSWDAIVEECLCVGWIDSLPGKVDDVRTRTYISPRKRGSGWSRRNKEILVRLEAEGLMLPAGRAAVDRARADGSWTLLDLAEDLVVPDDLAAALKANPAARQGYEDYPARTRKALLQWVYTARRVQTRTARVEAIVNAAGNGTRPRGF